MTEQEKQALNREIAEALGYSVSEQGSGFSLLTPDGKAVSVAWVSEAYAWAQVPAFADDLNACADALPDYMHMTIESLRQHARHEGFSVTLLDPTAETTALNYGNGATRQEAFARATLAWALATKARAT